MTQKTSDEAAIRTLIDEMSQALFAKDADRAVAHQSDDFVQFSLAPPLVSKDATPEGYNAWFATWQGPIKIEPHDLSLTIDGSVAFGHGLVRMQGTKIDGETADLWYRQSLGFVKRAGQWKIVHQHESVPFYMDGSFKAAIDLKP